jgi:hypothetical protein
MLDFSNRRTARIWLVAVAAMAISTGVGIATGSAQDASAPVGTSAAPRASSPSHTAQKSAKRYFIEFRSRSAQSYGHTFAVHGRVGTKITASNVVGLHPATESPVPWMIGHVFMVPSETGASDGDTEDQYVTARYRVLLTEPEYKKLSAYIAQLKASSPVWHAVLYNCNAFVGDIAKSMGLRVPESSLLMPKEYITALRQLNTGRAVQMQAGAASATAAN